MTKAIKRFSGVPMCRAATAVLVLLLHLSVGAQPVLELVRERFEWGEYGEMLRIAGSCAPESLEVLDTASLAQWHLYLGMALFSTGEIAQANDRFRLAYELDQSAGIDTFFSSASAREFYRTSIREYAKQKHETARRDSAASAMETAEKEKAALLLRMEHQKAERGRLYGIIATGSAAAAFGGLAGYEYYRAEKNYDRFLGYAEAGDSVQWAKYKNLVRRDDMYTMVFAGCAAASALPALYFAFFRSKKKEEAGKSAEVNFRIGIVYGIAFTVDIGI
jgi:hypothetical protein